MAINADEAFGIETFGIAMRDEDGNIKCYLATGSGAPSGPAPINTFYFNQSTQTIHYKYGALDTDWRQIRANDITSIAAAGTPPGANVEARLNAIAALYTPFDPTGLLNFAPTDINVQLALERFGNFSINDLTEAEGVTSIAQETTTSNGWVSKTGYPFLTSLSKTAGQFSIRWSSEVGQTTKNRNYGLRTRWRPEGGTWVVLGEVELSNARNNNFLMQSGFKQVILATNSKIEVDIQHGQTTGGGSSVLQNASMEIRRIGD